MNRPVVIESPSDEARLILEMGIDRNRDEARGVGWGVNEEQGNVGMEKGQFLGSSSSS